MQIFSQPLPLILWIALSAMHFILPILPGVWQRITKYANIYLHIALYFVLIFCRIPLDEVVLLFLLSLLFYILSALLWQKCHGKGCVQATDEKDGGKMP